MAEQPNPDAVDAVTNDSIDALLKQAEAAASGHTPAPAEAASTEPSPAAPAEVAVDVATTGAPSAVASTAAAKSAGEPAREPTIEELLQQANFEDAAAHTEAGAGGGEAAPNTQEFKLPSFQQVMADAQVSNIDLLRDVDLNVKIELGRSRMLVEDVLRLSEGSVVELDKLAGDPVDIFVNEKLVARGEVLVLNDNFCVRVNEIVAEVKEEAV
jgi:flagellar motor switch protein FliN/FliY